MVVMEYIKADSFWTSPQHKTTEDTTTSPLFCSKNEEILQNIYLTMGVKILFLSIRGIGEGVWKWAKGMGGKLRVIRSFLNKCCYYSAIKYILHLCQ